MTKPVTNKPHAALDRNRLRHGLFDASFGRLLGVMTLAALPFGTLEFILPLYVLVLGGSPSLIGLLVGVGAATGVLMRPLAGWLADRGRIGLVLHGGAVSLMFGMGCWALTSDSRVLLLGRVAVSAGIAGLGLAAQILVAALVAPHQRAAGFGRLAAASAVGHIIGAIIAVFVLVLWDAETQHEAQTMLLGLNISVRLPVPLDRIDAIHLLFGAFALGMGAALLLTVGRWPRTTNITQQVSFTQTWRSVAQNPALRRLIAVGLLISIGYSLAVPMILPLLQDTFDAGLGALAIAYAIPGVLYAAAPATLGRLADRWGRRRAATVGIWMSAAVYTLLPILPALMWVAVVWSAEALAYSLYVPALQALLVDAAPEQERGATFGLYSVVAGLGAVVAAPLGGVLYQYIAPEAPFLLSALTLLGAGVVVRRQTNRP